MFKKEDVLAIWVEDNLPGNYVAVCADCFDDDELVKADQIIEEKDLEEKYYFCSRCGDRIG